MIIDSPILSLHSHILSAPFQVAPELKEELYGWAKKAKFKLAFVREKGFDIRVYPQTAKCVLPIGALELLWVCAYAFLVFFDEYTQNQQRGLSKFDVTASTLSLQAWDLLQWALDNVRHSGAQKWPNTFPKPGTSDDMMSHVKLADELFLVAIAWILHHEIAHVRRNHGGGDTAYSVEQEKIADLDATNWILSKSPSQGHSTKRTLGIATAILALQTLEAPGSLVGFRTHPKAFERLFSCLESAGVGATDQVYAFAVVMLQIQTSQYDIEVDIHGPTFQAILHDILVKMARYKPA